MLELAGWGHYSDVITPLAHPGSLPLNFGLAPLRRSGLTLLLGRVGAMRFHMKRAMSQTPFKARAGGDGRERRRSSTSFWALVYCPSRDNCRGTQRRNSAGGDGQGGGAESNLFWALVYVPQGTTAGALNVATAGATQAACTNPTSLS